jgi:glycosyltransferase involved in cell wall biosynthesis
VSGLVVHYSDGTVFGGAELALLRTASAQRSRWRTVLLHHLTPPAPLLHHAASFGIDTVHMRRIGGKWDLRGFTRFRTALRELGCDVFHAHQHWPLAAKHGILAARLGAVPVVVATAQLFEDVPSSGFTTQQYRLVEKSLDSHVAVSRHVAAQLRRRFGPAPDKLTVIHNGVATGGEGNHDVAAVRREFAAAESPIILAPARLHEQKGLTWLLQAAAQIPDATVIIAGEGPLRGALEAESRALGISGRVHFPGYRSDIPALMAASTVVVLPSVNEGLPIVVLEAMEASRPVVATAIGGTDEAVQHGETGFLVPARDALALSGALQTVIRDPSLALQMGAAGRRRVREHFALESKVAELSALYERILDKRRGTRGLR